MKVLRDSCLAALPCAPAKSCACSPATRMGLAGPRTAGDKVDVDVATTALQDVRGRSQASLIAKVREADLAVHRRRNWRGGLAAAADPPVAGNTRIASRPRFVRAAMPGQARWKVPSSVDRASGDVHPDGNPHVQMDPRRIFVIAKALDARLVRNSIRRTRRPTRRASPTSSKRWLAAMAKWKAEAAPLKGTGGGCTTSAGSPAWDWLGIRTRSAPRTQTRVPPTAAHGLIVTITRTAHAIAIVRAAYQDQKPSRLAVLAHRCAAVTLLPFTVGGDGKSKDLFGLFDHIGKPALAGAK